MAQVELKDVAKRFGSTQVVHSTNLAIEDNEFKMAGDSKQEIAGKVQEAAEILELTPYLKRNPAELSGGQRQRVAMGRARRLILVLT